MQNINNTRHQVKFDQPKPNKYSAKPAETIVTAAWIINIVKMVINAKITT